LQPLSDDELVEAGFLDLEVYSEAFLKIAPKAGGTPMPFVFNRAQTHIHTEVERQLAEAGHVRKLILKGRQQGASTYVQARYYWKTSTNIGQRAFILTHDSGTTKRLFAMTDRYHRYSPEEIRPKIGASNANELFFQDLESGYEVGTAGNKAVGHGFTLQYFHGSETSRWPNAEDHLTGIFQAVSGERGTEIILESTANGVGGVFYDMVMEAHAGDGEYELIFVPWYWQPEYRKPFVKEGGILIPASEIELTEEEEFFRTQYKLDVQQIAWRRSKVHTLKSEAKFKEQYPFTIEEAFQASGRSVFADNWLTDAWYECYTPAERGDIQETTKRYIQRSDGELWIWEKPQRGKKYFIGGDPAEGLARGDYSVAEVVDDNGNQVAEYRGHIAPDKFADLLAGLGKMYLRAEIICERNNHGQLTLYRLAKEIGYPKLYTQVDFENQAEGKEVKKYGWLTTSKSKPLVIDLLVSLMRDGKSGIRSRVLVDECRTYVVDSRGRTNAQPGMHDDTIMAYSLAQYLAYSRRRRSRGTGGVGYSPTDDIAGY
jgi:hypothetical protein